jgi:hypothetical protein
MIEVRVFCEGDHPRSRMTYSVAKQYHTCVKCGAMITDESVVRAIPKPYQLMVTGEGGELLAAMADIGAFDVIYREPGILLVEYPRENQV